MELLSMALLEDDTKFPDFTLRKHTEPITSLCFVRVPLGCTRRLLRDGVESSSALLKPFLLSGDEKGNLTLWDLTTRRPIKSWRGHQGSILSIEQLGLKTGTIDDRLFGLVYSHGRDNCIKFWRLFNSMGNFSLEEVYDLPENALNFCNVDHRGSLIVSPNTLESGKFDVYDIAFLGDETPNENRLRRIFQGVDVFQIAAENGINIPEFKLKRADDDDGNRVDKFGIIMRLLFLENDQLAVGFESGHVATLQLSFEPSKVQILSITGEHFPNPVLSLCYDETNNMVASTSISSHVVFQDLATHHSRVVKLDHFGKIGGIVNIDNKYILSSWNGTTKFMEYHNGELQYSAKFTKPKGMITGDLNTIGSLQDSDKPLKKGTIKPNVLRIVDSVEVPESIRSAITRRDINIITSKILALGFEDCTIAVYTKF